NAAGYPRAHSTTSRSFPRSLWTSSPRFAHTFNSPPYWHGFRPRTSIASTSFTDPTRPDLHYHLVDPPTPISSTLPAFALSFLPSPPSSGTSSTIIGWLPAATTGTDEDAGLNDFRENRHPSNFISRSRLRTVLHQAVRDGLREEVDDIQINGARQIGSGWMHIHGVFEFLVIGCIIHPETYQAMPSYRICTSDGLTQLTPKLAQKLHEVLEARAKSENST
ncbi:hypothetical protein C8J57DRAFT_1271865, partial [Mycena rebaudengoi]